MKPTTMQRKYLLRAAMILLLIAGSYLVLWSSTKPQPTKATCTESMDDCCQKKDGKSQSGEMLWETISHQFVSSSLTN